MTTKIKLENGTVLDEDDFNSLSLQCVNLTPQAERFIQDKFYEFRESVPDSDLIADLDPIDTCVSYLRDQFLILVCQEANTEMLVYFTIELAAQEMDQLKNYLQRS